MTIESKPRRSAGIALRWGFAGALAWLLLVVAGALVLGPGGHPPAPAYLLPALALPSIFFRIGAGLGFPWLADASVLVAAPIEWGLLAAALGLSIRGRGPGRRVGLATLVFYLFPVLAPPLLLEIPAVARRAAGLDGSWVKAPAVETLALRGRPRDLPLLFRALERNQGIYREMSAAACGVTRWGGGPAWQGWASTPAGAAALPSVIWVAVDVLEHPESCPGPAIETVVGADEVRAGLTRQVLETLFDEQDTGMLHRAVNLLRDQIPPRDRDAYLPAMVAGLADPFSLHRAACLRVLLEAREGREIPDPVPWPDFGESDPQSADEAEIEACRARWSRWLDERRSSTP